eukprot:1157825-Pelagomonas_calceolata.AAC.5
MENAQHPLRSRAAQAIGQAARQHLSEAGCSVHRRSHFHLNRHQKETGNAAAAAAAAATIAATAAGLRRSMPQQSSKSFIA